MYVVQRSHVHRTYVNGAAGPHSVLKRSVLKRSVLKRSVARRSVAQTFCGSDVLFFGLLPSFGGRPGTVDHKVRPSYLARALIVQR
jgi:hypothetical protein